MLRRMSMLLAVLAVACSVHSAESESRKFALVLQAGNETNEGMARAVHALLYAKELLEKGYDVVLIFDGAGTGWASELAKPENPLHKHYARLKEMGVVEEICDYCAEAFGVKEKLSDLQRRLLVGDYEGHPSIAKWVARGYQPIVL